MIVWRVENSEGIGPYNAERTADCETFRIASLKGRADFWAQPAPWDGEFTGREQLRTTKRSPVLYGFPSLRAAVRWFGAKPIRELQKHGFELKKMRVTKAVVSNSGRQFVFRPPPKHPYRYSAHFARKVGKLP
jgi:hypothetical protein